MTVLKYVLAVLVGIAFALLINILFSKTIENKKHRIIIKGLSFCVSVILCVLFVLSTQIKKYASDILDFSILELEKRTRELSPELLTLEYDASSIEKLSDEIANLQSEIFEKSESDSGNMIANLVLGTFFNQITSRAENLEATVYLFQKENGMISVDSFLQGIKKLTLTKILPYFFIFRILVLFLFAGYIIASICIALYFKGGKKLYNRSIQFGEENTSLGMKNNF